MKTFRILFSALSVAAMTAGAATLMSPHAAHADNHAPMAEHGSMHVTKSPTCGCCGAWVGLAREAGFDVATRDVDDTTLAKRQANVPDHLWACHTATIDGYVVEGHVPFAAIAKLLKQRPEVTGISVPGMPAGSPGMGNDPAARYDVIAFGGAAGSGAVYYEAGQ